MIKYLRSPGFQHVVLIKDKTHLWEARKKIKSSFLLVTVAYTAVINSRLHLSRVNQFSQCSRQHAFSGLRFFLPKKSELIHFLPAMWSCNIFHSFTLISLGNIFQLLLLLLPGSIWWLRWLDPFSRECRIFGCQEQILCRPPELAF